MSSQNISFGWCCALNLCRQRVMFYHLFLQVDIQELRKLTLHVQRSYSLMVSLNCCYVWNNYRIGHLTSCSERQKLPKFSIENVNMIILILWELGIMHSRLWAGHWGIMVPCPAGESLSLNTSIRPALELWSPPPIFSGYRTLFVRVKSSRSVKLTTHLPL
jgi:hypothetical protein